MASRQRPRNRRSMAFLTTVLVVLLLCCPTLVAQDVSNSTNVSSTNATSPPPPPPLRVSPPPDTNTVPPPPPPPPARASMAQLTSEASVRVRQIARYTKSDHQCPAAVLSAPTVSGAPDKHLLLPPGRTWGSVHFALTNLTDKDFTRLDLPEPERFLEELVVDFALVATPDESSLTAADLTLTVPVVSAGDDSGDGTYTVVSSQIASGKRYVRVLPASRTSETSVDTASVPYLALDRSLAAFEDDAIVTAAFASLVVAVLTPDAPGTYVVLITAMDACNLTSFAFVNVTALCSHAPRPSVASGGSGTLLWDQASAANHADEAHPLGWWPARVLDGTGTEALDTDEGYYKTHKQWVDAEIWRGASSVVNFSADPNTALRTSDAQAWTWWTSAPLWGVSFRKEDGFLYQWRMTHAPEGSNAWRRLFNQHNATVGAPVLVTQTGAVIKYASASVEGETPFIDDADTVTASFTPDAVGTYTFTLDVSNVCHAATERFVSSFLCNAEPSEFRADVTRVNPKPEKHASMCLAKQTIEAYVVDADGDDVFVSWSHGAGDEGWDVFVTDEKTLVTNDTATNTNATTDGTAANATTDGTETRTPSSTPTVTTVSPWPPKTFADGTAFTGARRASGGAVLSPYVGTSTSFQPDTPGTYHLIATLTDGCVVVTEPVAVEVEWEAFCVNAGVAAVRTAFSVPVVLFLSALTLIWWTSKNTPTHPLDPNVVLDVAARLRQWDAQKNAVKRARLLLEHDRESAVPVDPVGPCLMEDFAKEALRKKRKEILRRASFESWWVSCVATATGAREQGGSLVPATTHVWRLVRFVGVFAEATTIAGLAFLGNTRPWWGDTVSVVGRALALQFDAPFLYAAHEIGFGAVCAGVVAVAAHACDTYRLRTGDTASERTGTDDDRNITSTDTTGRVTSSTKHSTSTTTPLAPQSGSSKTFSFTEDSEAREAQTPSFITTSLQFVASAMVNASPFIIWVIAEPLCVPIVASAAAVLTCTHGDAKVPFPHLARDDSRACYGTQDATRRLVTSVTVIGVLHPLISLYFATKVSQKLDPVAAETKWFGVFRFASKWFLGVFCVLVGEGDMTRHEPRDDTGYGVPSGSHKGYPANSHSARDTAHLFVLAIVIFVLYAVNFHAQPVRGAGGSRAMNGLRGACVASSFWISVCAFFITTQTEPPVTTGAVSVATETANAAVALIFTPLFFVAGYRHTVGRSLQFAYPDLSHMEMRRDVDPWVRAMGVLAGDATDGLCGAFGNWEGLRAHAAAVAARKKQRGVDSSAVSERLGVDRTVGVGLSGLTDEGREDVAHDALVWQIVMQVYFVAQGSGRYGDVRRASDASDDETKHGYDTFQKKRVFKECFDSELDPRDSFAVSPSVRVHFCDAVSALASSAKGVTHVQRFCLVPLLRRLLLDAEEKNAAVRTAAAGAVSNLAKSKRGASLLLQTDDDAFATSLYHRERDWCRVLIHLENKWGRVVSDVTRVYYYLGFGTKRADALTAVQLQKFNQLVDWNVERWLDEGRLLGGGKGAPKTGINGGVPYHDVLSVTPNLSPLALLWKRVFRRHELGTRETGAERNARSRTETEIQKVETYLSGRYTRGDVSTSECLSRTLSDASSDETTTINCIRAAGSLLHTLVRLGGKPCAKTAERRLRNLARKDLGPLWRLQGVFGYRTLFETWTQNDDDDFLLLTIPHARVMMRKRELDEKNKGEQKPKVSIAKMTEQFKDWYANATFAGSFWNPFLFKALGRKIPKHNGGDDSDSDSDDDDLQDDLQDAESDMVSVSADGDSETGIEDLVSSKTQKQNDPRDAFPFGFEGTPHETPIKFKTSPMDAALDAGKDTKSVPGLLEALVGCTAHASSLVRSAAHEELRAAAANDAAATIARRTLAFAVSGDSSGDDSSQGRVRTLEWLRSLVTQRYRVLANALAVAQDAEHEEGLARFNSVRNGFSANGNETEDFSLLHPGLRGAKTMAREVDLTKLAMAEVEPVTPCVESVLSRLGLMTIARCLDDEQCPAVRVVAIQTLREAWELLAAERSKKGDHDDDDGTAEYETTLRDEKHYEKRYETRYESVRVTRFRAANVFAKILEVKNGDRDAVVRRAADAFVVRVLQTENESVFDGGDSGSGSGDGEQPTWSDAPFLEAPPDRKGTRESTGKSLALSYDDDDDENKNEDEDENSLTATSFETSEQAIAAEVKSEKTYVDSGSAVSSVSTEALSDETSDGDKREASSWRFGRAGEERGFQHEDLVPGDADNTDNTDTEIPRIKRDTLKKNATATGASRWDRYVVTNAPQTVRFARTKVRREEIFSSPRIDPHEEHAKGAWQAHGVSSRFASFVGSPRRADVEVAGRGPSFGVDAGSRWETNDTVHDTAALSDDATGAKRDRRERDRRERVASGARQSRARFPKRSAPVAGTKIAGTNACVGDLTGPTPARRNKQLDMTNATHNAAPLFEGDGNRRLTWREKAAGYILAGGGGEGVGGQRRGPHEGALLRNGVVGLAGRPWVGRGGGGGVGVAPDTMFPSRDERLAFHPSRIGTSVRAESVYTDSDEEISGADRYRQRSRYAGSVISGGSGEYEREEFRGVR